MKSCDQKKSSKDGDCFKIAWNSFLITHDKLLQTCNDCIYPQHQKAIWHKVLTLLKSDNIFTGVNLTPVI